MVRMQLGGPDPVGTGAPTAGPKKKQNGRVAGATRDAPNPNGLGCGKCRGSAKGCKQCIKWLADDPTREKGDAWVPTDNMYPKTVLAARRGADRPTVRRPVSTEPLELPERAPAPELAPELAPAPAPAPALDDDDDDGGGGGGGSGSGSGSGGNSNSNNSNSFPNVSGDRESALMVVCDPSYVGPPIEKKDLMPIEDARRNLWLKREARGRRQRLTAAEKAQREKEIVQQVRNTHLVQSLPGYKCCARPLTEEERALLDANRETIDRARGALGGTRAEIVRGGIERAREVAENNAREAGGVDPDKHTDRALAEMNDQDLARYMGNYLPGGTAENGLRLVRDELQNRIARAAMEPRAEVDEEAIKVLAFGRSDDVQERMLKGYRDFMNEERRLIVQTIRNANHQVEVQLTSQGFPIRPANTNELGAGLLADQQEEWQAYFDGKREPEFALALAPGLDAGGNGDGDGDGGTLFRPLDENAWVHCGTMPPTSFELRVDWATNREAYVQEVAEAWCRHEVKADGAFPTGYVATSLADIGGGKPGQRWEFPFDRDRNEMRPGFWAALRRVREVKQELGIHQNQWACQDAFNKDPLIRAGQMVVIVTGHGGWKGARQRVVNGETKYIKTSDASLLMQLWRKHVGEEVSRSSVKPNNSLLATELLRCFPVLKPGKEVNSILEFVCWWYKTITNNEDGARESFARNNRNADAQYSDPRGAKERVLMLYDLMCCPDCQTYSAAMLMGTRQLKDADGERLVPQWAQLLRSQVNDRLGILLRLVEAIKNALDADVFKTPKEESVLWRGGHFYWEYKKRYMELNAPFERADGLREQAGALDMEREETGERMMDAVEEATAAALETTSLPKDDPTFEQLAARVDELNAQAGRLTDEHQVVVERHEAVKRELQAAETAETDAGVTDEQRAERDLALELFVGTERPDEDDVRLGQYAYKRWQLLNPMR